MTPNSIVLAATWNPRGEIDRFERILEHLQETYERIYISLPAQPDDPVGQAALLERLKGSAVFCHINPYWSWGRYMALKLASQSASPWIHYADMDRLIRWIEQRPDEWLRTLPVIQTCEYLVLGRTAQAYQTHPAALVQTEALSNAVISHIVGTQMDVSAGSKGFCLAAARYVIEHTTPGHALGVDGEWTVLLKQAGFKMGYLEVDGLDWESADRYQANAADALRQQQAAAAYDADPANWARRTAVAAEIIRIGLETAGRQETVKPRSRRNPEEWL